MACKSVRQEIRESQPGMAERALTSRATAVLLFCRECCGGSANEAAKCETRDCFLWPWGYAARRERGEAADEVGEQEAA